jgi:DNA helicase II / ATP-dependent DNA helicase PcrA
MSKSPLNAEQQAAVTFGGGPLLIIAGAGTGKTTVITNRIKHLIVERNISPSEVLALTFTEKAAREMEERIDVALPYGYTQMWIATFHAFCDRVLRDEAIHIGLNPAFKLATEAESIMFLRKHLYKFDLSYFRPLGNPYKFIQGLLQHFSRLRDDDITPEIYQKYVLELEKRQEIPVEEIQKSTELANAYVLYEKLKAEEGVMDFADLIANVLKLFRTRKNVLSYYQKKFKYILVDEFQDTNYAQNELAILLSGEKQNITVVGDDDQAIYRWRGAALANIIQFRTHFPKTKIITLIKNYRSTREILNTSYKLIQNNNPDRLEVTEQVDKKLHAMRDITGDEVELLFGTRVEHEADAVVEKILELSKKRKLQYKDFAILVRANDHAQPFTRALERASIPFQFLGPGHLFHQDEIKDLIAYMKVLYNFEDTASLYRILTHPIYGIEARDVAALLNFSKKQNACLFEALEQVEHAPLTQSSKEKARAIADMIHKHLKRIPKDTAGQILYYYLEDSGLLKTFINPESALSEKRAQNIAKFFEKLKTYEVEHEDASIFAVVDWIELSMQLGESPLAADIDWAENNAVNILTVHSSKGLEFPVVFVVNLVSQRFPTRDRKDQIPVPEELVKEVAPQGDNNLSEERRLFYVAMTRAKDMLFLSAANYYGEGKRERKISPFVYEALGETYVNSVIKKKKEEASVTQLTFLDIVKNGEKHRFDDEGTVKQPLSALYPVNYISYSQIQTFDTCPLHYKLKYILKIPPFPTPALSFGSSVHGVLREFYQAKIKGAAITPDAIETLLQKGWIKEGYTSRDHEKSAYEQAKKILQRYIEHNGIVPLATEIPFQFSLPGLKVGGRIDRIDKLENGMIEIIDYKTGSNMPDGKKLLTDLQMTLYGLAATSVHDELFNKSPSDILLSLYYLNTDTKLTTTRTTEQLEEVKEILKKKAEEISKSDFACSVANCKNCEYKMLCQTYSE